MDMNKALQQVEEILAKATGGQVGWQRLFSYKAGYFQSFLCALEKPMLEPLDDYQELHDNALVMDGRKMGSSRNINWNIGWIVIATEYGTYNACRSAWENEDYKVFGESVTADDFNIFINATKKKVAESRVDK